MEQRIHTGVLVQIAEQGEFQERLRRVPLGQGRIIALHKIIKKALTPGVMRLQKWAATPWTSRFRSGYFPDTSETTCSKGTGISRMLSSLPSCQVAPPL